MRQVIGWKFQLDTYIYIYRPAIGWSIIAPPFLFSQIIVVRNRGGWKFVLKLMEKVWSTKFSLTEDPRARDENFFQDFYSHPLQEKIWNIFCQEIWNKTNICQVRSVVGGKQNDRRKNALRQKLFGLSIFFLGSHFLHISGKSGQ